MTDIRPFLTAQWRNLVMINYCVDPQVVAAHAPPGTEVDLCDGETYISMVGFNFIDTRLIGVPILGHTQFEEVNLRFYVRRRGPEGWRRGVVFLRELVPRRAVAWTANWVYGERYAVRAMDHDVAIPGRVEYRWRRGNVPWERLWAEVEATEPTPLTEGSHEQFIAEHYWGYTAGRGGRTREYQVAHPPWRMWPAVDYGLEADVETLYGPPWAEYLRAAPVSAFVAEGSAVAVGWGRRLLPKYDAV